MVASTDLTIGVAPGASSKITWNNWAVALLTVTSRSALWLKWFNHLLIRALSCFWDRLELITSLLTVVQPFGHSIRGKRYMSSHSIQHSTTGQWLLAGLIVKTTGKTIARSSKSCMWLRTWDNSGGTWQTMFLTLSGPSRQSPNRSK